MQNQYSGRQRKRLQEVTLKETKDVLSTGREFTRFVYRLDLKITIFYVLLEITNVTRANIDKAYDLSETCSMYADIPAPDTHREQTNKHTRTPDDPQLDMTGWTTFCSLCNALPAPI